MTAEPEITEEPPPGRMQVLGTIAVVSICGWLVMQIEILGARVLTPYFGAQIYVVMGSVIGVFLLSLSVGYMLGGWYSGRPTSKLLLGGSLAVAGAWLVAAHEVSEPLCDGLLDAGFSPAWGSLIAAFVLFGVPIVGLGTVSPTAVRWLTSSARESGFSAGMVLACSTAASFAGTLVTAFYLLRFSMRLTISISGVILLLLGAIVLGHGLYQRRLTPPGGER